MLHCAARAVCILLCITAGSDGQNTEANEPGEIEQWQKIDHEFPVSYLPQAFWDSLRVVNNVSQNRGLRKLETPLYLRNERLAYSAQWGPIKAGYAVLAYHSDTAANTMRLSIKGMTNRFVSAFYEVRDCFCSMIDADGLYPLTFEEHIHEGRYRAKRWALYDHEKEMAYSSSKKSPQSEIIPFSHDLMSLLYIVRSTEMAPGDTFTIPCFVQGKNYPVFFRCTERKRITVEAGSFDCIGVMPRLIGEGRNFSQKDKITIWMTDDQYRIPVLVKSKIKVGSVTGELIYYE